MAWWVKGVLHGYENQRSQKKPGVVATSLTLALGWGQGVET